MPRLVKAAPRLRKHRTGQGVVTVNGRDAYLGIYGLRATSKRYREVIAAWEASGRSRNFDPRNPDDTTKATQSPAVPVSKLSVVELVAKYWNHATAYYGEGKNSELHRLRYVLKTCRELYGRTLACEFSPLKFAAVRDALVSQGLARSTANHQASRLRRMFRWGVEVELVPGSVYHALSAVTPLRAGRTAARETKPVEPVADEVIAATLPHLRPIPRDMVALHRLLGTRPDELCRMRFADIDRTGDVWLYRLREHKTAAYGKSRIIPIGPRGQEILRKYLNRPVDAYIFSPRESMAAYRREQSATRKTPLSCGNRPGSNRRHRPKRQPGERFTPDAYAANVAAACQRAFPAPDEIRHDAQAVKAWHVAHRWSPLQIRHQTATSTRKAFGLEHAQVLLGHADIKTTQRYAEVDLSKAIEVARAIG